MTKDRSRFLSLNRVVWILVFYVLTATLVQIFSGIRPTSEHSPMDFSGAGLLCMLSLLAFLSYRSAELRRKKLFWFFASVALLLLAMDELFSGHEKTAAVVGDDDHIKVLFWVMTGGVLWLLARMEGASPAARNALVIGYFSHTLYVLVETGDGDYFALPGPKSLLKWAEEVFELSFLSSYLMAFYLFREKRASRKGKI